MEKPAGNEGMIINTSAHATEQNRARAHNVAHVKLQRGISQTNFMVNTAVL